MPSFWPTQSISAISSAALPAHAPETRRKISAIDLGELHGVGREQHVAHAFRRLLRRDGVLVVAHDGRAFAVPGDAVAGEAGVQRVAVLAGRHGGGPDVLQVAGGRSWFPEWPPRGGAAKASAAAAAAVADAAAFTKLRRFIEAPVPHFSCGRHRPLWYALHELSTRIHKLLSDPATAPWRSPLGNARNRAATARERLLIMWP